MHLSVPCSARQKDKKLPLGAPCTTLERDTYLRSTALIELNFNIMKVCTNKNTYPLINFRRRRFSYDLNILVLVY